MPTRRLAGVFPIGFTPVNAENQVDFDGLAAQVQFCRRGGVHGLAWPQIASGWTTLTEEERMHGADAIISAARGGTTAIVIGVQSRTADFKETDRYAEQAEKLGADAIICLAPPGVTAPSEFCLLSGARKGDIIAVLCADCRRLQCRLARRNVPQRRYISIRER